jgi:hypothetical protein
MAHRALSCVTDCKRTKDADIARYFFPDVQVGSGACSCACQAGLGMHSSARLNSI